MKNAKEGKTVGIAPKVTVWSWALQSVLAKDLCAEAFAHP